MHENTAYLHMYVRTHMYVSTYLLWISDVDDLCDCPLSKGREKVP